MFGDMNDLSVSISILEYIESVWDIASFIVFLLPGCNTWSARVNILHLQM